MQVGTTPWSTPDVFEDDQNTGSYMKSAAALSFAMVFFEVLTGEEPFANMPQHEILPSI